MVQSNKQEMMTWEAPPYHLNSTRTHLFQLGQHNVTHLYLGKKLMFNSENMQSQAICSQKQETNSDSTQKWVNGYNSEY